MEINSNKQEVWANDIKIRIEILLNGFKIKCSDSEEDKQIIYRVENLLKNSSINFIIDEYKSLTDIAVVKMFYLTDTKYCKVFKVLFNNSNSLHDIKKKQREQLKKKFSLLKDKYYNNKL